MANERANGRIDFTVRCAERRDRRTLLQWYATPEIQLALEDEPLSMWERRWKIGKLLDSDPCEDGQAAFVFDLDSRSVGFVNFMWINWISRTAEIDFMLAPGVMHPPLRGLMLLQRTGRIAFHEFNLHKIYAVIYERNAVSLRLLKRFMRIEAHLKNYVKRDGHYEDAYLAAMTREDYLALTPRDRG